MYYGNHSITVLRNNSNWCFVSGWLNCVHRAAIIMYIMRGNSLRIVKKKSSLFVQPNTPEDKQNRCDCEFTENYKEFSFVKGKSCQPKIYLRVFKTLEYSKINYFYKVLLFCLSVKLDIKYLYKVLKFK